MRVLLVCDNYFPAIGGIEVTLQTLAESLAEEGHSVTVLTRKAPGTASRESLRGVRIVRIASPGRALFALVALPAALRLARESDIIHVSPYASAHMGTLLRILQQRPVLLHVHGFLGTLVTRSLYPRLYAWFVTLFERSIFFLPWRHVVVVSADLGHRLIDQKLLHHPPVVIPNSIDTQLFDPNTPAAQRALYGIPEHVPLLLFAARPSPLKGFPLLAKTLPRLFAEHPTLHLALFIPREQADHSLVYKALGNLLSHPQLHLYPAVPHKDMPSLYAMADGVLVLSQSEGFCFQAVEACAMKKPLLCPDLPIFREVVSGRVCFLPRYDEEGLSLALHTFLTGGGEQLAPKTFPPSRMVTSFLALYGHMCGKGGTLGDIAHKQ